MSKEKRKKFSHGGAREGAGHPKTGITKKKICISINQQTWQAAFGSWTGKASHFIEMLVSDHVKRSASDQNTEAAT